MALAGNAAAQEGPSAAEIRAVEEALAKQKLDPGPVDGNLDGATRSAIREFCLRAQFPARGLKVAEEVTLALQVFLGAVLAETVERYRRSAEAGDAASQAALGTIYAGGYAIGAEPDFDQAITWYNRAIAQGEPSALVELGVLYENGSGVDEDYEKAIALYRDAAEKGDMRAYYFLGLNHLLGLGVEQDLGAAAGWFEKAADAGHADAQNFIGEYYENGTGGSPDPERARHYYRLAAELGYAKAQRNLAELYDHGIGVAEDDEEAVKWYRLAARYGDPVASARLEELAP